MNPVTSAIWKSTGLHLALGGMLIVSMDFHSPIEAPDVSAVTPIQAVVVDAKEIEQVFEKIEQEKRAVEQEKVRKREEQQRKAQQAEEARKKRIAKEKAEKERKRKEAEKKKKEKEKKEREEKERKEKARKEKEEKERKEREKTEREKKERLEQERLMREQLEEERAAAQASRRNKQILTEVQKYTGLIKSKIIQNWIIDDTMRGKSCRLNIQLASNGLVLRVNVLEGDPTVCRTSETAVLKAETLPVSKDPEVFKEFRNFNLTMSPEVR